MIDMLLRAGARILPRAHRDRWLEETRGLLAEVHGARRRRYAADVLLKLPSLRRSLGGAPDRPRRGAHVLAGLAMLASTALVAGAPVLATVIGEDSAEALFMLGPFGLAPAVAMRALAVHRAAGQGAARTALTIVGAGLGAPLAVLLLGLATAGPLGVLATPALVVALVLALAPAAWLISTSLSDLRSRSAPAGLCGLGLVAGVALSTVLLAFAAGMASLPPPTTVAILGMVTLIPAYLVWSVWTALRLLRSKSGPATAPLT